MNTWLLFAVYVSIAVSTPLAMIAGRRAAERDCKRELHVALHIPGTSAIAPLTMAPSSVSPEMLSLVKRSLADLGHQVDDASIIADFREAASRVVDPKARAKALKRVDQLAVA